MRALKIPLLIILLLILALVGAVVVIAIRPAIILGADTDSLAKAMEGNVGVLGTLACDERDDGSYGCKVQRESGQRGTSFSVEVTRGCWEATRRRLGSRAGAGAGGRSSSGCISLLDYLGI